MTTIKTRTARRWSNVEDANLRAGVLNGLTTATLAKQLNRTLASVSCRKNQLGMHDVRIASPIGNARNRNEVKPQPVVKTQAVKSVAAKSPKTPDAISAIAETVSRMTKQYGVKATVIVFEN